MNGTVLELFDDVSKYFLMVLIIIFPIMWVPHVKPSKVWLFKEILIIGYILVRSAHMLLSVKIKIISSKITLMMFSLIILMIAKAGTGFDINIAFITFGYLASVHFYENRRLMNQTLHLLVVSLGISALYALFVTLTPLNGFEPIAYTGGVPYSALFDRSIDANSFAFYHRDHFTVPLSMGAILSIGLMNELDEKKKLIYLILSFIMLIEVANVINITGGHGRSGTVVLLFALIVIVFQKARLTYFIPYIVLSPIFIWISVLALLNISSVPDLVYSLDNFMSGRVSLYTDSLLVISNNPLGISKINWGTVPLSDVGVTGTSKLRFSQTVTRPHNFLFEITIINGIVAGFIIVYWIYTICRHTVTLLKIDQFGLEWALGVVTIGSIFAGLLVGGLGPFVGVSNNYIIWWICFSSLISTLALKLDQQ